MATTWKKYQAGFYYTENNGATAVIRKKTYSARNVGSCDYWTLSINKERVGTFSTMKRAKQTYETMV